MHFPNVPELKHQPGEAETKISERTFLSLHFVIVLLIFSVWVVRLGDRVEADGKLLAELKASVDASKDQISRLEGRIDRANRSK